MPLSNDIVQEIRIQVRNENAKRAFSDTSKSIITLNQGLELAQKAFRLLKGSADLAMDALDRGEVVTNLNRGFETLQANAGLLASDSLAKLRVATRGLASDMDLMQAANQAAQLGLDPATFDQVAEAARKLGEAVGRDAVDSINSATTAIGRQSPMMLDNLGITLKMAEAQREYAADLGKVVSQLTEKEKAEAFGAIATKRIVEEGKKLTDGNLNASQSFRQLKVSLSNAFSEMAEGVASSTDLANAFQELTGNINGLDFFTLGRQIGDVATIFVETANNARRLAEWLDIIDKKSFRVTAARTNVSAALTNAESIDAAKVSLDSFRGAQERVLANIEKEIELANKKFQAAEKSIWSSAIQEKRALDELIEKRNEQKAVIAEIDAGLAMITRRREIEAKKGVEGIRQLTEEQQKQKAAYDDFLRTVEMKSLDRVLSDALAELDSEKFNAALDQWEDNFRASTLAALEKSMGDYAKSPEVKAAIDEVADLEADARAKAFREKRKAEIEERLNTVASSFESAIDAALSGDKVFDLERALIGAAKSFGSELIKSGDLTAAFAGGGLAIGGPIVGKGFEAAFSDLSDGIKNLNEVAAALAVIAGGAGVFGAANELGVTGSKATGASVAAAANASGSIGNAGFFGSIAGGSGIASLAGPLGVLFGAGTFGGGGPTPQEAALKGIESFLEDRLSGAGGFSGQGVQLDENIVFGQLEDFADGWSETFATVENEGFLAFDSVGKAMNQMLGTGEDVGGALGFILSENLGGDVNNLRLFVQALDIDIKQLEDTMIEAGKRGEESWSMVDSALEGLSQAAGEGLVAVGDIEGAFAQLIDSGGKGAFALQAVENIATEAIEKGATSLEQVKQQLLASGSFTDEQVNQLFGAFEAEGVQSFEQLKEAGDRVFIGVVAELERAGFQFSEWRDDIGASTQSMNELGEETNRTERELDRLERRTSAVGGTFREARADAEAFRRELQRIKTEAGSTEFSENNNFVG